MILLPHKEVVGERFSLHFVEPSTDEVKKAWDLLCELSGKDYHERVTLKFNGQVPLRINRTKVKEVTEAHVGLFVSESGALCYTFSRSTGYPISSLISKQIVELAISSKEKDRQIAINKMASLCERD